MNDEMDPLVKGESERKQVVHVQYFVGNQTMHQKKDVTRALLI
jgi:hypothetical protein